MSIAHILALLSGADESTAVANVAVDLAKTLPCSLTARYVKPGLGAQGYFGGMGEGPSPYVHVVVEEMQRVAQKEAATAKQIFESACAARAVNMGAGRAATSAQWDEPIDGPEEVGRHGRLSDVIVVGQPTPIKTGDAAQIFDAALFRARRSVLVVPDYAPGLSLNTIAIAYDGRAEAVRAANGAVPLLRKASQVHIITVGDLDDTVPPPAELKAYLARHGVEAALCPQKKDSSVGETIHARAKSLSADFIVMGGYTHSQLRELVLGGGTRDMLSKSTIPMLMAH